VKGRGRHERLDDGSVAEYLMTGSSLPDRWTISNVVLTSAVVVGPVLCYFLAIPFRLVGYAGRSLRCLGYEDPKVHTFRGAPGVVLGPLIVSLSLSLMEI
jgi:hypothetical protein